MKTRPTASDEEIKGYMNFDAVLKQHAAKRAAQQKLIRAGLLLTGALCVGIVAYWIFPTDNQEPELEPAPHTEASAPAPSAGDQVSDSVAVAQTAAPATQATHTQEHSSGKSGAIGTKTQTEPGTIEQPRLDYVEAEPEVGFPRLYEYFSQELNYPTEALTDSIQGVVSVQFVINTKGKPEKITIQNSLGPAFDQEAIRLIEQMPAWKPAQLNGKPIASKLAIPITFQLSNSKVPQQ